MSLSAGPRTFIIFTFVCWSRGGGGKFGQMQCQTFENARYSVLKLSTSFFFAALLFSRSRFKSFFTITLGRFLPFTYHGTSFLTITFSFKIKFHYHVRAKKAFNVSRN